MNLKREKRATRIESIDTHHALCVMQRLGETPTSKAGPVEHGLVAYLSRK